MQDRLTIDDPEVAHILVETKPLRLLEPFMKRPLTLSEAQKS